MIELKHKEYNQCQLPTGGGFNWLVTFFIDNLGG